MSVLDAIDAYLDNAKALVQKLRTDEQAQTDSAAAEATATATFTGDFATEPAPPVETPPVETPPVAPVDSAPAVAPAEETAPVGGPVDAAGNPTQ